MFTHIVPVLSLERARSNDTRVITSALSTQVGVSNPILLTIRNQGSSEKWLILGGGREDTSRA